MSAASYLALVNDIYTITARPDLIAETALAVRKATMKCHLADLWKNDLATALVPMPVLDGALVSFRYSLDLTQAATFPLIRRVSSIDEYNIVPTGYEVHFKELDNDRILDSYLLEEINYWYQAGRQVSLRANKSLAYLAVDYWKFPDITTTNYTSWIADQFPDMILEEACASVFSSCGKDSESQRYAARFQENLAMLRTSEI